MKREEIVKQLYEKYDELLTLVNAVEALAKRNPEVAGIVHEALRDLEEAPDKIEQAIWILERLKIQ